MLLFRRLHSLHITQMLFLSIVLFLGLMMSMDGEFFPVSLVIFFVVYGWIFIVLLHIGHFVLLYCCLRTLMSSFVILIL